MIALGLAIIATTLIRAFFGPLVHWLESLPVIGGTLAYPFKAAAQALTNAMGAVEHGIDKAIGFMFHVLAEQFSWLWREIKSHAALIALVAPMLAAAIYAIRHLRHFTHSIAHHAHGVTHAVRRLEKEWHGIEHRVRHLEREIGQGIGHDLRTRVAGLEDTLGNVTGRVIPSLRTAVNDATTDLANLRKWITDNIPLPGTTAFTGAVAVALAALGLSWLRCDRNPFNGNRNACGLWGDLGDLLGLVIAAEAVLDFEQLVHEAQDVAEVTSEAIMAVFGLSNG